MTELFSPRQELTIGRIVEVNGNGLRIELDDNINELVRAVDGKNYAIGQVGSVIKIHFGRKVLFAFVRLLRMRSELQEHESNKNTVILSGDDSRLLEADLFGQGEWSTSTQTLSFSRGVEIYPLPLQSAYLCLNRELESVYTAAEFTAKENAVSPMVPIGNYVGSNSAVCRANIDKLFGHHFAILGSTGSGKSGTVCSILHSVLEYEHDGPKLNSNIIMIDPHGEYAKAFGDTAQVYRAYNEAAANTADGDMLKLPYWLMSSDELRSLIIGKTEFEATSQANIFYEAVAYARQVEADLVENIGENPVGGAQAELKQGKTQEQLLNFDRDKPAPFKLEEFEKHVDKVQGRKTDKCENLAASGRDKVDSILKKLRVLRTNPQLNFIMQELSEESPSLQDVLEQFIGHTKGKRIQIIDISGLPNEVAGPLTALIARLLFQYKLWQTREEREKDPVLFICEEAHRYVPNHGEVQYKEAQAAIKKIAKEGRKYGLGLGLVSQRPSDVESTVLSQCNSWIVLRLTNSSDQEHVAKFLPDSLSGLTKMLPALTRREAIFVGEAAALPSRIRIKELPEDKLPDSNDIKFAEGWLNDPISKDGMKAIIDRWCS